MEALVSTVLYAVNSKKKIRTGLFCVCNNRKVLRFRKTSSAQHSNVNKNIYISLLLFDITLIDMIDLPFAKKKKKINKRQKKKKSISIYMPYCSRKRRIEGWVCWTDDEMIDR